MTIKALREQLSRMQQLESIITQEDRFLSSLSGMRDLIIKIEVEGSRDDGTEIANIQFGDRRYGPVHIGFLSAIARDIAIDRADLQSELLDMEQKLRLSLREP